MSLTIVTVLKSGPNWLPEYVYTLKNSIERNLSIPHDFVCLSDINLQIKTLPLIPLHGEKSKSVPGFWFKPQIFRKELNLTGQCLYIDLDTVISGKLDDIINQLIPYNFLMAEDPFKGKIHSSFLLWWQGDHSYIWNRFETEPVSFWNSKFNKDNGMISYGDQGFISDTVDSYKLIQDVLLNPRDIDRIRKTKNESNSKVLICSGKRKPWELLDHPDVKKYWF
jgi:hypothetical protein